MRVNFLRSSCSLVKWYATSICFVPGLLRRVSAMLMEEVFSAWIETEMDCASYEKALMYQSACRVVKQSAMCLDSIVERETEFCFLENQEIGELLRRKTYPDTEQWVSR